MTSILRAVAANFGRDVENADLVSHHLLDTIGAWLAGRDSSEGQEIARAQIAPALSSGVLDDIVREVAITRLTEIDDIHRASCTTCGSVIIPTALLLAQALNSDRKTFLRAVVHGYEAMMRLGQAANGPAILAKGIWSSYLVAPFGAATAASILLGLTEERAANALALALQQSSGAPGGHPHGKSARWLLIGYAARIGVTSALMAQQGYAGDLTLLDGDWLERTHGISLNPAAFHNLSPCFHETSMKAWCSAKQTTSAIGAFRRLLARGLNADEIVRIQVAVPNAYQMMISSQPPGRLGRIVNLGWQFGLCAYAPESMLSLDRNCGAKESAVTELARKVEVVADPCLNSAYPKTWPARVRILMNDGSHHEQESHSALGDPELPMSPTELRMKFDAVTRGKAQDIATVLEHPLSDESFKSLLGHLRARLG